MKDSYLNRTVEKIVDQFIDEDFHCENERVNFIDIPIHTPNISVPEELYIDDTSKKYIDIGVSNFYNENYNVALTYLKECENYLADKKLCDHDHNKNKQDILFIIANYIARANFYIKNFDESLFYFNKIKDLHETNCTQNKNSSNSFVKEWFSAYQWIAEIYSIKENYDKQIEYYEYFLNEIIDSFSERSTDHETKNILASAYLKMAYLYIAHRRPTVKYAMTRYITYIKECKEKNIEKKLTFFDFNNEHIEHYKDTKNYIYKSRTLLEELVEEVPENREFRESLDSVNTLINTIFIHDECYIIKLMHRIIGLKS